MCITNTWFCLFIGVHLGNWKLYRSGSNNIDSLFRTHKHHVKSRELRIILYSRHLRSLNAVTFLMVAREQLEKSDLRQNMAAMEVEKGLIATILSNQRTRCIKAFHIKWVLSCKLTYSKSNFTVSRIRKTFVFELWFRIEWWLHTHSGVPYRL